MIGLIDFLRSRDHEKDVFEFEARTPAPPASTASINPRPEAESHASRPPVVRMPASSAKPAVARPHFSRPTTHSRDRKPAQSSNGSHPARRTSPESRTSGARRPVTGTRPAPAGTRWGSNAASSTKRNGTHPPAQRVDCGRKAALLVRPTAPPAHEPQSLPLRRGDGVTAILPAPKPQPRQARPHA